MGRHHRRWGEQHPRSPPRDGTAPGRRGDRAGRRDRAAPWQDKAQTADQLAEAAKTTRSLTGKLLAEMAAAGKVSRIGKGKKGDPFRYWRESDGEPEMLSSTYRGVVVDESISEGAGPTNG